MKEYGGYNVYNADRKKGVIDFDKENTYWLNLGRNALKLLLKTVKPDKIFVPVFTCETVHEVVEQCVENVVYYNINSDFSPLLNEKINETDYLIINDYFGVCKIMIENWSRLNPCQLIIDSSQSFFSQYTIMEHHRFISPRKFFGLTDGGMLETYIDCNSIFNDLSHDLSSDRIVHLFKSEESSKNEQYPFFLEYRKSIQNLPLLKLSKTTMSILDSIDFEYCSSKRNDNFKLMSNMLGHLNQLKLNLDNDSVPMYYPFLCNNSKLKTQLLKEKIYLPSYWPNSIYNSSYNNLEKFLQSNLCCLPIDQSLELDDIMYIVNKVLLSLNR